MPLPTRYPPAVWRPVRNTSGSMMLPTRGLIPHVQQGNGSLYGWFNNPTSGVSAHLWISKSGYVEQYVDFDRKAWAQAAGNPYWISVECEGFVSEDYTPAQFNALAALYAWGMQVFSWPPSITDRVDGRGIGTHRMGGAAWGAHECPGDLRASRRIHILAAAVALVESEEDDMPITDAEVDRIASAVLTKIGVVIPQGQTTVGGTIAESLRTVQFLVNALGLGRWQGGQSTLADRVGAVHDELSRVGDHLGPNGGLVQWLQQIATEVGSIRADLAHRAEVAGVDVSPVLARLDNLTFQVVPSALTAPDGR